MTSEETCPQWPSGFPIDNKGKALWSVKYNIRDHDHCFKKEYDGEKKGARRHALLVPNKREDQGDPAAGCLEMFATLDCVGASEKMPFSLQGQSCSQEVRWVAADTTSDLNANCYTFDQADHPNERAPTGYASYKFHPIVSRL